MSLQPQYVDTIEGRLDRIELLLGRLIDNLTVTRQEMAMARADMEAALADLQTEVAENSDVTQSAISLIQGIATQLEEAAGDPAAVRALAASLSAKTDQLAAAVTANTPT